MGDLEINWTFGNDWWKREPSLAVKFTRNSDGTMSNPVYETVLNPAPMPWVCELPTSAAAGTKYQSSPAANHRL
jgi:hypothetical protein